ncbi:MAG: hypothetical protein RL099_1503 [Bacteroidota bacterium]|jgi:short subunit dehydrogenase-like uncharacterized protein
MSFLIYGANGYTANLTIELAIKQGLKPVIAGRSEHKIKPIAEKFGLEYLVFGLDNQSELVGYLEKFDLVLNCAGPFIRTAKQMVEACLIAKTHYLDITGEVSVFEMIKSYNDQALKSNIVLMPGVGFDVVPTDCLSKYLHTQLPDATHLQIAFTTVGGSISHGTLITMIQNLGNKGAIRKNGVIVATPIGQKGQEVDFGKIKRFAMSIPWGDISTAYHTTHIPNIEAYRGVSKNTYLAWKFQFLFNPILKKKIIRKQLQAYVDKKIIGPTESQNQNGQSLIWGKATNAHGKSVEARLETAEGYKLTAEASLLIVKKILATKNVAGYQTPAGMFGYKLILEIPGTNGFF